MQDLVPMLVSTLLGTLVGWERQLGHKPAGLRTHTLVCMGSTLFVLLTAHSITAFGNGHDVDPTRIIHGVVTGVGFLGAGTIIRQEGLVHGLTTAASVWMVAAIGVAVGCRAYWLAGGATLLALIVLEGYGWIEHMLARGGESAE